MKSNTTQTKLSEALVQMETCLETPIVPGEMERWSDAVGEAVAAVEPLYRDVVQEEHPRKWKQTANEDPGLWRRVEQMKEDDQKGLELFEQLKTLLNRLTDKASTIEPDESRLEDRIQKAVDDGLAFVIHVRKQEAAVDTWLIEAFERDRGVVD